MTTPATQKREEQSHGNPTADKRFESSFSRTAYVFVLPIKKIRGYRALTGSTWEFRICR
jgi:hypothetical protein